MLLDPAVPDNPINRRISIVVMNKHTEEAITHENGSLLSVQHSVEHSADEPGITGPSMPVVVQMEAVPAAGS